MGIYHTNPPEVPTGMTDAEKAMSFLTTTAESILTGEQVVGTKAAANGLASLDASILVPLTQIPIAGKKYGIHFLNELGNTVAAGAAAYITFYDTWATFVVVSFPVTGVLRNLLARVEANTLDAACTVDVLLNAGLTAISVTIGAGATGTFTDLVNTAVVAANDFAVIRINATGASAGSILVRLATLEMQFS